MNFRDNNIGHRPLSSRTKLELPKTRSTDCLTECEWEVFVIRRDDRSGTFKTETACCEKALVKE